MAGNQNSGRRPKATTLKVLQGNPGKRPLNDAEPIPPDGKPEQPSYISGDAALVWADIAPVAMAMGTLTVADVSSFAALCELEASRRSTSKAKDSRELFRVANDGNSGDMVVMIDDIISTEVKLTNALRPYYEKFGLEPSGRARIRLPKKPVESKWAGLVG